jgi:LmbE family N-acetylglucosaminyl deacetylase
MTRNTATVTVLALALAFINGRVSCRDLTRKPDTKLTVVVFGGHPDDPESGAGGLIGMLTLAGHDVICAYGTTFRGDRRFFGRQEGEVRREEATAACSILGAKPKFFPFAHEKFVADEANLKEVASWLARVKPDIVVTQWPLDTHPNHHTVSSLVWQCYQRHGGWNLYFFEVMTDQQTIAFAPDLFLDIAPVRDMKRRSLGAHKSQNPDEIWQVHERMHKRRGKECGVDYAEAYKLVEAKEGCPTLPLSFLSRKNSDRSHLWHRPLSQALLHHASGQFRDRLAQNLRRGFRIPGAEFLAVRRTPRQVRVERVSE